MNVTKQFNKKYSLRLSRLSIYKQQIMCPTHICLQYIFLLINLSNIMLRLYFLLKTQAMRVIYNFLVRDLINRTSSLILNQLDHEQILWLPPQFYK